MFWAIFTALGCSLQVFQLFCLEICLACFGQCLTPTNFRARPRMHLFHFLLNHKKTLLVSTGRSQALSLSLNFFGGLLETCMTNLVSLVWPVCVPEGQSQRSWLLPGHWSLTKLTSSVLGSSFWNSGSPGMRLASFLRGPSLSRLALPALILKQAFEGETLPFKETGRH